MSEQYKKVIFMNDNNEWKQEAVNIYYQNYKAINIETFSF